MPRAHIAAWQDASHADSAIAPSPEHTAALKPRQMKISYVPTTREPVPFLRLRGKWLAQAGFAIGSDVRISIAPQRLVIDIKSPEGKTKKQIRDERRAALRDNNTTVGTDVYPSLGDVEMIRDRACVRRCTLQSALAVKCASRDDRQPGPDERGVLPCLRQRRAPTESRDLHRDSVDTQPGST